MPASALDLLQPLLPALMPVPAVQSGICRICHSSTKEPRFTMCSRCTFDASGMRPTEVVPITMSVNHELVHHHLRNYKDGRTEEDRERLTGRLAALLATFLGNHSQCLGEWDYAACVPSADRHAVRAIADRTRRLNGNVRPVLTTVSGDWGREFTAERFALEQPVVGDRILLIDDTYASGASIHSAAAALRDGGAEIVGPLVIGRHVNPAHPPSAQMLDWLRDRRWDPERCCRCSGEMRDPNTLF